MLKSYVIKVNELLYIIKSNQVPNELWCELPSGFEGERGEWLIPVEEIDSQTGSITRTVKVDTEKKNDIILNEDRELKKKKLYTTMSSEVLIEMKKVFGTSNSSSATAYYETWREMFDDPIYFSTKGIKSDIEVFDSTGSIVLIKKGDLLDSADLIKTYAGYRIKKAKEYSVWRLSRIQKFRDDVKMLYI